jgi:hypothetical protein
MDLLTHDRQGTDHRDGNEHQNQSVLCVRLSGLIALHLHIVGRLSRPGIGEVASPATADSGSGLLRNPYPAFANCPRDRFELGVNIELREDVLHVSPDRVRGHLQR